MTTASHNDFLPPAFAKLFWNGKSQAVRLPKAFRLAGDEVMVRKSGNEIILSPKPKGKKTNSGQWDALFAAMPEVDNAFMNKRALNKPLKPKKIF